MGKEEEKKKKPDFALYVELLGCWLPEGAKVGMETEAQRCRHPRHFDAGPSHARREVGDGSGAGSSPALVPSLVLGEQIRPGHDEVSSPFLPWGIPVLSASLAATSQAGIFPRNGFSRS